MSSIYKKLFNIQQEIKVPKGQFNDFGSFWHRSLEDILEALKPMLKAQNCVILLSNSMKDCGGRVYSTTTAKLVDVESGDSIEVCADAREAVSKTKFDDSQLSGAATSYSRKYALAGLLAIDDTKDADHNSYSMQSGSHENQIYPAKLISKKQESIIMNLITLCAAHQENVEQGMVKYFKVESISKLPANLFEKAKGILEKKLSSFGAEGKGQSQKTEIEIE